jgi:hypothetical protein
MKTVLTVAVTIAAMVALAGAALAFMRPGHGPGGMGHGMMMYMGPHMMAQGAGPMGPGMGHGMMSATQVNEDQAKAVAQKYVDEQLEGFTIEKVVPSTGMPRTMYTIELKGPNGESKTLHISPFGHVMPIALPQRQG